MADNFGSDDLYGDIDESLLLAAAEQADAVSKTPAKRGEYKGSEFDDLLDGAFDSDDLLEDELEITGHTVAIRTSPRKLPFSSQRGASSGTGNGVVQSARQPVPSLRRSGTSENLRQSTLLGGYVQEVEEPLTGAQINPSGQRWPMMDAPSEPPSHHHIDEEAAKTWIYPTNVSQRDYQFNIVKRALFTNVLVALPTGLGKTFIAAVVMLNWYRWAPKSQIVFLAPTKPLVHQQIKACREIVGIPESDTAVMTGNNKTTQRAEYWEDKRILYLTPQTMENDIKKGICDPKKIVLIVIDEAHRATGNYAYCQVIRQLRRTNKSFRVLALTATPGSTLEAIQNITDELGIATVEIRSEDSIDIRQYVNKKDIDTKVIELSPEIKELKDLYCKCLQPLVDDLYKAKAYYINDAEKITAFGVSDAVRKWMNSPAIVNSSWAVKGPMMAKAGFLAALAHPLTMLNYHGIRVFHKTLTAVRDGVGNDGKQTKLRTRFFENRDCLQLMRLMKEFVDDKNMWSHPKMQFLVECILDHLEAAERKKEETRVMIFTSFRDSAEDIIRTLKNFPMVKPHIFVGQADSKGGTSGMSQSVQVQTLADYKSGKFNTLVATSIGEEGLDIGEVDLIICYDSSASPIRLLQRMGRTGRKRDGKVYVLLSKGKEEEAYRKALDNYQWVQKMITAGKLGLRHDLSPRILPKHIQPDLEKKQIEIPPENTEPATGKRPGGKKRITKLPPKKFHMPDGVETGFVTASSMGGKKQSKLKLLKAESSESEGENSSTDLDKEISELPGNEDTYLISQKEKEHLQELFGKLAPGASGLVEYPDLCSRYEDQRVLRPVHAIPHSRTTKSYVELCKKIHEIDVFPSICSAYQDNFDPSFLLDKDPPFVPDPFIKRKPKPRTELMSKFGLNLKASEDKKRSSPTAPTKSGPAKKAKHEHPVTVSPLLSSDEEVDENHQTRRSTPEFVDLTSSQEEKILPRNQSTCKTAIFTKPKVDPKPITSLNDILQQVDSNVMDDIEDDDSDFPDLANLPVAKKQPAKRKPKSDAKAPAKRVKKAGPSSEASISKPKPKTATRKRS